MNFWLLNQLRTILEQLKKENPGEVSGWHQTTLIMINRWTNQD